MPPVVKRPMPFMAQSVMIEGDSENLMHKAPPTVLGAQPGCAVREDQVTA